MSGLLGVHPTGPLWLCHRTIGLATCFGASTVMLGSGAAEPVAVCDTAVPLKLHSHDIDKIAIAEGAKRLDEDLMTLSSQIQDDYAVLVLYGTTHVQ